MSNILLVAICGGHSPDPLQFELVVDDVKETLPRMVAPGASRIETVSPKWFRARAPITCSNHQAAKRKLLEGA